MPIIRAPRTPEQEAEAWAEHKPIKVFRSGSNPPRLSPGGRGKVYIARAEDGLHKIGQTRGSVLVRVRAIGSQKRMRVELIHSIPTNATAWAEEYLHKVFEGQRVEGEWFRLSEEEVTWIRSLATLDMDAQGQLAGE